jgi:phosphoribosylglycinamide formyltransferase-1
MIVLAGFLWLVPRNLTELFTVINIHPALLPKYGGKGMYGANVHKAVLASKDKESGISIHQVNQDYDKGKIMFQATCPIVSGDTPETLAARIHELEHQHYPRVIEELLLSEDEDN